MKKASLLLFFLSSCSPIEEQKCVLSMPEISLIYMCGQINGQEGTHSIITGQVTTEPELPFCVKYREIAVRNSARVIPRSAPKEVP